MRRPRLEVPGIPMHVVHRGVDRARVFRDDDDRQHYLIDLADCAHEAGVAVHGYVLMDNHVHLLLSADRRGAVAELFRALGPRFVGRHNRRHDRTGTLWEGRYRSFLVETERYLLACLAYVELNPVRAGMVATPWEHPWSSVHHHLGRRRDPVVSVHPVFSALSACPQARGEAWRSVLAATMPQETLDLFRRQAIEERAVGGDGFLDDVAARTGLATRPVRRGRPPARAGE